MKVCDVVGVAIDATIHHSDLKPHPTSNQSLQPTADRSDV
jgi:hypothetical protein